MTAEEFTAYFFNSTTIVGIVGDKKESLEEAVAGRPIEEALGGAVYMYVTRLMPLTNSKPNYPGRSSHVSRLMA
jgi:hypothetical protein